MNLCLVDTDVVSILFRTTDPRGVACAQAVAGRELIISFVTLRSWVAAIARQWDIELVTGNFRDYAGVSDLRVVPIE